MTKRFVLRPFRHFYWTSNNIYALCQDFISQFTTAKKVDVTIRAKNPKSIGFRKMVRCEGNFAHFHHNKDLKFQIFYNEIISMEHLGIKDGDTFWVKVIPARLNTSLEY